MPNDEDYRALLRFRIRLRRFDQWSRGEAEAHGLTHAQHQLLLAVRGFEGDPGGPDHRRRRRRCCWSSTTPRASWSTGPSHSGSSSGCATTTTTAACGCG